MPLENVLIIDIAPYQTGVVASKKAMAQQIVVVRLTQKCLATAKGC